MHPIALSPTDLAVGSSLIFLCALLSLLLSLGIHRTLLWAAARMVVQLLLIGFVLRFVFSVGSPWLTALVALVMAGATTYEVGARQDRRLTAGWHYGVGGGATVISTLIIVVLALTTALRPHPWYDARHALPLTGIILGGVMNSVSLSLNSLFNGAVRERAAIEARLALGDSRYAALRDLAAQSIRTALIPTINQMMAAGLITLPGIMTGQLLAGMDPVSSAKYQILLMFLLVGGNCCGAFAAVFLVLQRLTDKRDRLRLDRLHSARA
ncbi:ABC transporter permease [Acidisoma silvae]|uniref:Iron export ABC transporter permease subunit FetB n=1 Tax=Acidisoma silvae TaxID=2802396 RepID=A0A964DYC3_9PROT|nr:iron export ABC transporter permease subunit FetB [Acidisoma silvae]MCB8874623.1 iron export ABC transporter permease subunit FetB [Acidisoma silvae]